MEFIAITLHGAPARPIENLPGIALDVMRSTAEMYVLKDSRQPWVGYLAVEDNQCVGTCGFKTAPVAGRVEIAYFTFPGNEGRGVATRMARCLIDIAFQQAADIRVCAQTLAKRNASTHVLEKVGFRMVAGLEHPEDGKVWEWEFPERAQLDTAPDGNSATLHPRKRAWTFAAAAPDDRHTDHTSLFC